MIPMQYIILFVVVIIIILYRYQRENILVYKLKYIILALPGPLLL